jgi:hypothetical protein
MLSEFDPIVGSVQSCYMAKELRSVCSSNSVETYPGVISTHQQACSRTLQRHNVSHAAAPSLPVPGPFTFPAQRTSTAHADTSQLLLTACCDVPQCTHSSYSLTCRACVLALLLGLVPAPPLKRMLPAGT